MNKIRSHAHRIKSVFSRLGRDPETDWYFSLAFLAIALAALVTIDAYVAFDVTRSPEDHGQEARKSIAIDRDALAKAALSIRSKASLQNLLPPALLRDPSN